MKVLWLTTDYHRLSVGGPLRHYYFTLEDELCKIADVALVGRVPTTRDAVTLVEEHDPDVVMIYDKIWDTKNLDKISPPKAVWCSDPWRRIHDHAKWINENDIDLVCLLHGAAQPEYERLTNARCVGMFQSLSAKIFHPLDLERIYDVFQTGDLNAEAYPLRNAIFHSYRNDPACWVRTGFHSIPTLDEYVRKVNQSKILATGSCHREVLGTRYKFFQVKPLEAMATEGLAMMDAPTCTDELHLVAGENYVEISRRNFRKKIRYYLKEDEERQAIAEQGYETYVNHHSSAQRAKQVLAELERLVKEA